MHVYRPLPDALELGSKHVSSSMSSSRQTGWLHARTVTGGLWIPAMARDIAPELADARVEDVYEEVLAE
jgi:hypothetical protein